VGIDLARRAKHKAVALTSQEAASPRAARSKPISFAHDRAGFQALLDQLRAEAGTTSLAGVKVNVEPTSGVWETVAGFLRAHGAEVFFTRTDVVSALRKVHSKFAKTDRIDARTLAGVPCSFPERLAPVVEVEPRIRALRQLSAQRQRLVEDQTAWKNRLGAKLEIVWAPLMRSLNQDQRFSDLAHAFFKHFARPAQVVARGRESFLAWCKKYAHGNTSSATFEPFWQGAVQSAQLWELLDKDQAIAVDWDVLHDLVRQDLRLIETLEKEIQKTDARIDEARREVPECDVVQTLPGVGVLRVEPERPLETLPRLGAVPQLQVRPAQAVVQALPFGPGLEPLGKLVAGLRIPARVIEAPGVAGPHLLDIRVRVREVEIGALPGQAVEVRQRLPILAEFEERIGQADGRVVIRRIERHASWNAWRAT